MEQQMAQAISIPNTSSTRRKALTAIATLAGAAAVVTPVGAAQAVTQEDPIFALIKYHKLANAAVEAVYKAYAAADNTDPPDELGEQHHQIETIALAKVLSTPPTTLAGVAAVLDYVGIESVEEGETVLTYSAGHCNTRQEAAAFLSMIAATTARLSV
jgi:hypothetical protein